MLAMTRKEGQTLIVDGPAVIHFGEAWGNSVKVAVEADPSVRIWRGELYDRIQASQAAVATEGSAADAPCGSIVPEVE